MKNSTVVIYVNPVDRIPTQGRDQQSYNFIDPKTQQLIKGKPMRKTRETGTEAVYMFQPNQYTGKYNTGLDEKIVNPFKDSTVDFMMSEYNLPLKWRDELNKVVEAKEITKQTYYEILHAQEPGFYRSDFILENTIFKWTPGKNVKDKQFSFIDTFRITLYDGANRFTDETPRGAMAIQLIKNHSKIAQSKKDTNPVQHTYYVSEENEAEMEKMRKQDLIDEAVYSKLELQRKSPAYKNFQVASMCTTVDFKPIVKGVVTQDQVKIALNNYLSDGRDQMKNVDKFMTVIELLKSTETKSLFEVKYVIAQAYYYGILGRKDGYTYWFSKKDNPTKYKWSSDDALVSFMVSEYNTYDPDDSGQNWYIDLVNETKAKGAWIE